MKGLDTPPLLEILEGRASARKLLGSLEGEEVCTTELNLLELVAVAKGLGPTGLAGRLAAIDHLRRGLTVLPLDARAASLAASKWRKGPPSYSISAWLMAGALAANGCREWISDRRGSLPAVDPKLRIARRNI